MARYWSRPMSMVERRVVEEAKVAARVKIQQKKYFSKRAEATWSSKVSGVNTDRENRLDNTRFRINLELKIIIIEFPVLLLD